MVTDNSTADGFANDTTKMKRSKAMDMRFYWIQDRVKQGQFTVHWQRGKGNLADYFTKHHPPSHHMKVRPTYLQVAQLITLLPPECEGVLIHPGLNLKSLSPEPGLSPQSDLKSPSPTPGLSHKSSQSLQSQITLAATELPVSE